MAAQLLLGNDDVRSPCTSGRHERVANRKRKRNEAVAVSAHLEMNTSVDTSDICVSMNPMMTMFVIRCIPRLTITLPLVTVTLCRIQTEMTCQAISELELDNRVRVVELSCLKCCTIYVREMYVGAHDKVSF